MRHLRYVLIVSCLRRYVAWRIVFCPGDNALKSGTVRGRITDLTPTQNPIEDVEVKIVAQGSGKEWTTKTNADGKYEQALGFQSGRYLISISKERIRRSGWKTRCGC